MNSCPLATPTSSTSSASSMPSPSSTPSPSSIPSSPGGSMPVEKRGTEPCDQAMRLRAVNDGEDGERIEGGERVEDVARDGSWSPYVYSPDDYPAVALYKFLVNRGFTLTVAKGRLRVFP